MAFLFNSFQKPVAEIGENYQHLRLSLDNSDNLAPQKRRLQNLIEAFVGKSLFNSISDFLQQSSYIHMFHSRCSNIKMSYTQVSYFKEFKV
jgi:hypothetical protein